MTKWREGVFSRAEGVDRIIIMLLLCDSTTLLLLHSFFFWQTGVFKLFEYLIILRSECSFLFYTHQVIIKSFLKKKIYYNEESHESDPNMLERNFKLRSIRYHETLKTTKPIHWGLIALLISFVRIFSQKKKKKIHL